MKYIDEFRNLNLARKLARLLKSVIPAGAKINIMEVCGTHTQSFFRFGLDELISDNLRLIAGPGCPVCVSPREYIDNAINLAQKKDTIIATFGDMLRIPGKESTLEKERAKGATVEVVYSAIQSITIAKQNPDKKIIFLAVGFETTAPTIALTILLAEKAKLENLFFYSSLKLIPPAMEYLVKDKRLNLKGFLCPGHVSAIIGIKPYEFIPKKYGIACCVTGFEPLDILRGIYMLVEQIVGDTPKVENQYSRVVNRLGNTKAQRIIKKVFRTHDASWRGLGKIPKSGLKISDEFVRFDAIKKFKLSEKQSKSDSKLSQCKCADILKGLLSPLDCPLFSRLCSPENPIGPCMVSSEGACNAYYKYH